jgi:hypothetical protein
MTEMDKLAKDGKGFSRWTQDPDTRRQQGIGKEKEDYPTTLSTHFHFDCTWRITNNYLQRTQKPTSQH